MRIDTSAYVNANNLPQKEPRFVVELSFDWDNQDVWYFTSHADAALPVAASVHHSVVTMSSVVQQTLAPDQARATIGSISFGLRDKGGVISGLFAIKFSAGDSLKGRRVRVYRGYKGLSWTDYVPVTQQVRGAELKGRAWSISCADVQRELRKDVFDLAVTQLAASVTETDTTIQVVKTADFQMVAHGPSYSDAPNQTVGYIKIEKEVIRYTGKTAGAFTGCTRGVMNTVAAQHTVSGGQGADVKIEEFVYIELPAVKAAYAIMTGVGLPSRWNLGVNTALVDVAEFNAVGADLYNPADDSAGIVFRFEGLSKTDGKKFIEEQIFQPLGLFAPVKSSGALGLRRLAAPLPGSGYVAELNPSNVVSVDALQLDFDAIHNWAVIQWNYDHNDKKFTRTSAGFLDTNSINAHGISEKPTTLALRGLHGSRHSADVLQDAFDYFRNSYVGPVWRTSVECKYGLNNVEIGDFVRLKIDELTDPYTGQPLDRVVRVDGASDDLVRGTVSLTVTGATEAATPIPATDAATALPDAFYSSVGTPLQNVLSITVTGGVGHVTANGTLTGGSDMNGAGAIYYYDGNLTIDNGVTIAISNNVQLRVRGFLTVDGIINGRGAGLSGGVFGGAVPAAGYIGTTESMGGFYTSFDGYPTADSRRGVNISGAVQSVPWLSIKYSGGQLSGIPADMRGTPGGAGVATNVWDWSYPAGGNGGYGGAAIAVICRGMALGSSGSIDLSGSDGIIGAYVEQPYRNNEYFCGGSGAGGYPGAMLVLLDGDVVYPAELPAHLVSNSGRTPLPPDPGYQLPAARANARQGVKNYSYFKGFYNEIAKCNILGVQYLPVESAPVADASITIVLPPASVSLASDEPHLLTQKDGTQIPRLLITWGASPDIYKKGYQLQYKRSADAAWTTITGYADRDATSEYVTGFSEGEIIYVRARTVNRFNNESAWVTAGPHTIIGKTSAPPPVDSVTVVAQSNGSHSISVVYGNRPRDYRSLMMLVDGVIAHSDIDAFDFISPATASNLSVVGTHAVDIVAVDTGGRVSAAVSRQVITSKPGAPQQFLVSRDADGTRRFTGVAPVVTTFSVAGYRVRYKLGAGQIWQNMTPAHNGLLTSWPYETNQLAAGFYTFAAVAVDVAGNESDPVYIEATIGDPRLAGALDIIQPHLESWPGTQTNCALDVATGWLLANDTKNWDDLAASGKTWDTWTSWTQASATLIYTYPVIDVGVITRFSPLLSAEYIGNATLEVRTSSDNIAWSAFGPPSGQVTARYVQPRVTVAPSAAADVVAALQAMTLILDAAPVVEDLDDVVMSGLSGGYRIAVGDVRVPITRQYGVIKRVEVSLQNVGPGWSWEIVDKNISPGPRIRVYNASNVLADAVIDITVRGV